jgi:hypothetical protein
MASSKMPAKFVLVPDWAIALQGKIACNLRPEQRSPEVIEKEKHLTWIDGYYVDDSVSRFLHRLRRGATVAILFQGYGTEVGSAIIKLEGVYWTDEYLPRLDFVHPAGMEKVNGCPNFWGSCLLAIMSVPSGSMEQAELGENLFRTIAEAQHRLTERPKWTKKTRAKWITNAPYPPPKEVIFTGDQAG